MDAKKIGYLRRAPSPGATPLGAVGPLKAMLNKLCLTGHVEQSSAGYRKTAAGEQAVEDFDAGLSDGCREILNLLADGQKVPRDTKGIMHLINAGLIDNGLQAISPLRLTYAGEALQNAFAENTPPSP